jgi:hypothetical protein
VRACRGERGSGERQEGESKGEPARSRFLTARWRDWMGGAEISLSPLLASARCSPWLRVGDGEEREATTRLDLLPSRLTHAQTLGLDRVQPAERMPPRRNAARTPAPAPAPAPSSSSSSAPPPPLPPSLQHGKDKARETAHGIVGAVNTLWSNYLEQSQSPTNLFVRLKLTPPRVEYSPCPFEVGRQLHVLPHAHRNRPIRLLLRRHKLPFQRLYRRVSSRLPSLSLCPRFSS